MALSSHRATRESSEIWIRRKNLHTGCVPKIRNTSKPTAMCRQRNREFERDGREAEEGHTKRTLPDAVNMSGKTPVGFQIDTRFALLDDKIRNRSQY